MSLRPFPMAGRCLFAVVAAAAVTVGCGIISSQSVYEGVRSTEKAKAVVTDKSRGELPPYDEYEKARRQAGQ